jgi:[acyl-carrier-protein] S-malonyltransferase
VLVNATVGTVETLRETIPVVAPHGGLVVEWLVEDGDPVAPGQPIIRLHPIAQEAQS